MAALSFSGASPAFAADQSSQPYLDAVYQAYYLIVDAQPSDTGPAVEAVKILESTDEKPAEIIADLQARPPEYADAKARLQALISALQDPATTADPSLAHQRLHDVLAMSRYDALRRPPTPLERFVQWLRDRLTALLRYLLRSTPAGAMPDWVFYAIGVAVIAVVAFVVFRAARGRLKESLAVAPSGPRPPADYFAEADTLAARGDRVGAIRALCAAVAATIAGEHSWEGSPLTVREIFQRAPDHASLRPLLLPFEAAIYGGRDIDQATYDRAALAAARFRQPVPAAA